MKKSLKEVFLNEAMPRKKRMIFDVDGMRININSVLKKAGRLNRLVDKFSDEMSYLMVIENLEDREDISQRDVVREMRAFNKRLERAHDALEKIQSGIFNLKQETGAPD